MSLFRRAGASIAKFFIGTAPSPVPNAIQLYSNVALGLPQLFAKTSDGTIYQLTPISGGGGGSAYVMVYQPGGVSSGNVYATWAEVVVAQAAVAGQKLIEIDDTITSPAVVPAGTYNLPDCAIVGSWLRPTTQLQLDDGVVFTNFRKFSTNIRVSCSDTTPPITDLTGTNNRFVFDDRASSFSGKLITCAPTNKDNAVIEVRNGSQLRATSPKTVVNGAGFLRVILFGPGSEAPGVDRGTGSLAVDVYSVTPGFDNVTPPQDLGSQLSINGIMSRLPRIALAGNFFGGTNPVSVLFDIDTSGGAANCLNMRPANLHAGEFVAFKKSNDFNTLLVQTGSGETIDHLETPYILAAPNESVLMLSDGISNWIVVATANRGPSGGSADFGDTIRVPTTFGGNFATQHDWTPPGYTSSTKVIVIESQDGGTQGIGGLTGGYDGRVITIMKVLSGGGGYPANIPYAQGLFFVTEDVGSTDINRFAANWQNNSFGQRPSAFTARYDGTINRWVPIFLQLG